jgi:hypothetical protein
MELVITIKYSMIGPLHLGEQPMQPHTNTTQVSATSARSISQPLLLRVVQATAVRSHTTLLQHPTNIDGMQPLKSHGLSKRVIRWCLFEKDCTSDASAGVSAEDATAAATQHAAAECLPAAVWCASIRKPCSAGCLALLLDVDALTLQHC